MRSFQAEADTGRFQPCCRLGSCACGWKARKADEETPEIFRVSFKEVQTQVSHEERCCRNTGKSYYGKDHCLQKARSKLPEAGLMLQWWGEVSYSLLYTWHLVKEIIFRSGNCWRHLVSSVQQEKQELPHLGCFCHLFFLLNTKESEYFWNAFCI